MTLNGVIAKLTKVGKVRRTVHGYVCRVSPDVTIEFASAGGEVELLTVNLGDSRITATSVSEAISMATVDAFDPHEAEQLPEPIFTTVEKFALLSDFVKMVGTRVSRSLIVTGTGGLGKTREVMNTLNQLGFRKNNGFVKISGHSSPRGLYEFLYRNREGLIVCDDCDSVFTTPVGVNLLKAALDSNDERTLSWEAPVSEEDPIPNSFEFTGGIVFISNLSREKLPQPIRSRALNVDLTLTLNERLERIESLIPVLASQVGLPMEDANTVFAFLLDKRSLCDDITIRTMLELMKLRKTLEEKWERAALYFLTNS